MREWGTSKRRGKWSEGWMHRVWAVLTRDSAKAGPFIIGSHQALLPVMCWKMGSNVVICFMLPALLGSTDTHSRAHTQTRHIHKLRYVHAPAHIHHDRRIHTHM